MSGTSNFLQHDPNATNAESDSLYLSDSFRTGGGASGALVPSTFFNKVLYQLTTFVTSFCQMMAAKNYSPNDGSANPSTAIANLVGVLMNVLTVEDLSASGFAVSLLPKGYIKFGSLLGGLVIQWSYGAVDPANSTLPQQSVAWPISFPTTCLWAGVSMNLATPGQHANFWYQTGGWTASAVTVQRQLTQDDAGVPNYCDGSTSTPYVIGIGY